MNNTQKFLGGVILGAAAGIALAMFLNSEKGKELISDISDAAGGAADNLKRKFSDFEKQTKDLLAKGKTFIEEMEGKTKDISGEEAV